ncbi:MAG: hypothetical protein KF764_00730 [Labilithrix sp.]|nr:hypothetical protein [Labilithrix sp.]MBX3219184.1 hypothetical protein [Labilithrix sp.]
MSRRAALAGIASLVACRTTSSGEGLHDPSTANDSWAGKVFGRPPAAVLIKRVQGIVPNHDEEPFFRGWQIGWQTWWPNASRSATQTEIWEDPSGEKIAIFRGIGQVDPRTASWIDRGRTRAGVWELHAARLGDRFRMFVLPDGTWIAGWGTVALRLSGHFAAGASASPPRVDPKPTALFVQQFARSPTYREVGMSSAALYASDEIRGVTVATYGAAPGAEVPTTLDIVYSTAALAQASAQDLNRIRAASRADGVSVIDQFFRRAVIASEGNAVVLRSFLPFEKLVYWTRG